MRTKLIDCIVNHVFDNFGLTNETKIRLNGDNFFLPETLSIINENEEQKCRLWGTQLNIAGQNNSQLRIICTDFNFEMNNADMEFALIIELDDCPLYGCHLSIDTQTGDPYDGLLLFALENKNWMPTNTFLQATFLAGLENLKEEFSECQPLKDYDDMVENMNSFAKYIFDGEEDEG